MKRTSLIFLFTLFALKLCAQTTITADYKIINIGDNGYGDYTRALILLHEVYNNTLIDHNYAIGTITAMRGNSGSFNRLNVVNINTSSAYNSTSASLNSYDDNLSGSAWKLKTCIYNNKKYIAVDIPYSPAYHNWGYWFNGSTTSTGESMKCVAYEVNGSAVNQNIISNIQDFSSNLIETHDAGLNVTGNVGIGTTTPDAKLTVNGTVHSKEVKVDLNVPGPDYVFEKDYKLKTLTEVQKYIAANKHLPEIPSAKTMEQNGVDLSNMNMQLLKKVEELTLYMIEKDEKEQKYFKQLLKQRDQIKLLKKQVLLIEKRN